MGILLTRLVAQGRAWPTAIVEQCADGRFEVARADPSEQEASPRPGRLSTPPHPKRVPRCQVASSAWPQTERRRGHEKGSRPQSRANHDFLHK
jgi:hypothetical protein